MATFRDDLARVGRGVGRRLLDAAQFTSGQELVPAGTLDIAESAESDNRLLRRRLEYIGNKLLSYGGGTADQPGRLPAEAEHEQRINAARQALNAWANDPMAGQVADLYTSFVLGRGVPKPNAHDDVVQDLLDETWADPSNQLILTSLPKLVEKLIDLSNQANVFVTFFDNGKDGQVRVSMLTFEDVIDVVRHPKNKYRILYYKVQERNVEYDYKLGRLVVPTGEQPTRVVYYEAVNAFDDDPDSVWSKQDEAAGGRASLEPPADMIGEGRVYHLAVNKGSEMAFGVPRPMRMMRWWNAHNEVMESHVKRMRAAASVYMKATVKGNQADLDRLADMALGRRSVFQASREYAETPFGAPPVGGVLGQNESLNYEPFKLDSGAQDVSLSAPELRAQGSGPFPGHYFGGQAESVAGSQSMELPTLKFIELDQEIVVGVLRALAQARIDASLKTGLLPEWRDPTEDERMEMAAAVTSGEELSFEISEDGMQVKRDLGFELSLPSPLKRTMTDVVTAVSSTLSMIDPQGNNPEAMRWAFASVLPEFGYDDPSRIVDRVLPKHLMQAQLAAVADIDPETGEPRVEPDPEDAKLTGSDGKKHNADNAAGAKRQSPDPEDRKITEAAAPADPFAAFMATTGTVLDALDALDDVETPAA